MENVSNTHPVSSYDLLIISSWNRQIRSRVSTNSPTAYKVPLIFIQGQAL
jgi:hypothetical protein